MTLNVEPGRLATSDYGLLAWMGWVVEGLSGGNRAEGPPGSERWRLGSGAPTTDLSNRG